MMNRVLLIVFACISFNMSTAQSSINDYKYVIVEDQFNFQSEPGQYNLNGLVHFLLRKHGFTSIIEGQELPADLKANFCLALRADVTVKGALRTRAAIVFKDCESNEIYRTAEGVTKEKDFARAYDLAIRKTSESLKSLNYVYTPNQNIIEKGRPEEVTKVVEQAKNEIEELKAEIKELKEEKEEKQIEKKEDDNKVTEEPKEIQPEVKDNIEKKTKVEELKINTQTGIHQETHPDITITQAHLEKQYIAKVNNEGPREKFDLFSRLQLKGKTQQPLFSMYKTILNDVYIFEYNGTSGTITKRENGDWIMESIVNGAYRIEKIDINFQ